MTYSIGFSPCPNDTFIFEALVNGRIDTEGLRFEPVLEDIQTLNQWAAEGRLDITKLSFPSFFRNEDRYVALPSGAALGKGVGPLLVAKQLVNLPDIRHCRIAIPGALTTANLLLSFAFPEAINREAFLFSEIEDAVLLNKVDLGVLIHENRFTYQQRGLVRVCDLGEIWEQRQGVPIPLACIAARRTLPEGDREKIGRLIRKSVEFAFANYPQLTDYTRQHAQAMEDEVMRQHIELYVNQYSVDLGPEGQAAIDQLKKIYQSIH